MAFQNQAVPKLKPMLQLSSASQKVIGCQLTIPIFDSSLEDLTEELFSCYNPK
jgi:peroxiredoxin family protein